MVIAPLPKAVNASDISPERLAGNTVLSEQQKIAEASRQFEAILLRQILSSTQKTVIPSKFTDNSTAADIYRDMITNQLAESISKSGAFGLAKAFEHQLTRPAAAPDLGAPASRRRLPLGEGSRNADVTPGLPASPSPQNRIPEGPVNAVVQSSGAEMLRHCPSSFLSQFSSSPAGQLVNTHE